MIRRIGVIGNRLVRAAALAVAAVFMLFGVLTLTDALSTEVRALPKDYLVKMISDKEEDRRTDLKSLSEINPDVTGWIEVSGTNIDYPVMQGKKESEYLNKDMYGNYTVSGSIFLSVSNKRDYSEPYQLIYGHHMENGSMFGDIDKFKSADFFYNEGGKRFEDEEGVLITEDAVYSLEAYALIETDAYDEMIYRTDRVGDDISRLISYAEEKAVYIRDVGELNHILALSTCNNEITFGRTVLLMKVNAGEAVPDGQE